jgi:ubiquinone/menaquinone biosynthesis C-methylase UbiE
MSTSHAQFTGSIPEYYDTYLGPMLFEPYARDMAERVARLNASSVLELACGTGIVTRRLLDILPRDSHLLATDLNEAMLDYARPKFTKDTNVKLEAMDATRLTLPPDTFEVVVCQFGWMFFPDKLAVARESRRVLRPDGHLLFNVWDSFGGNPICRIAHETITSFFESDPADFYLTPFGFHDLGEIRMMLDDAGFKKVDADTIAFTTESPSANEAATGLIRGNPVVNAIHERGAADVDTIVRAVADALANELGDRPMRAPIKAHVVVAS